ncbi:MAG TPA: hypothetical protein RMH85_24995 [Polyangiaceae bacterium LLY-WYZ-15_(1-7)]|nr:hypothetical protein [Myxococcales bacterium]MAT23624.1 hypothetical protein [Sandaracinus sp.]HJL02512.1 hypothetical protein [Polyangiaceae bacterium LLY-WYZ-15_(1-7)]MBJ71771.1 hypothetical protein [Sandaracinus sp.]HJL11757.1 hypothetical protein [Polyangiaceae bacterium LLY-WYZ-15_(1-7)]
MKDAAVVIGLGQLGSVFAHALLRHGHPVVPVNRGDVLATVAQEIPPPAVALVTVGERDLVPVLEALPDTWRDRVALVQNELLPADWAPYDLDPTVAVVWFEKKKTIATNVILPTPIAGPRAALLADALATLEIPAEVIEADALPPALVAKNVYILTMNLAGLAAEGTVGTLWEQHLPLVDRVLDDVLALQAALLGAPVDEAAQREHLAAAIAADPEHGARGRSAPARLERALAHADALDLEVPTLRELAAENLAT